MSRMPSYDTKLFTEIYNNAENFVEDYQASGLYNEEMDDNIETIFYLLYAKHGNDPIANYDVNQFKYKMWAIIYQYGPSWVKRLDIQKKLRALDETDILEGARAIYNHAYNPSTAPTTQTTTELDYINEQNVTKYSKAKLDAYTQLWDILRADVTNDFINKFDSLFKQFVRPERTWIYITERDEEDDEQ